MHSKAYFSLVPSSNGLLFFFVRLTSCVFSTDCDERFENLAIVLERIAPPSLSSSHSKGWKYVLDWYRLWKSDVSGAVRTTYLIPFEWLLNGLRTANRQQRFRVRGHHFFWLSVLTSLNYFSCFLSWYCTKLSDL